MTSWNWTLWVLFVGLCFALSCDSTDENAPVRVSLLDYDRTCSTNDECAAVRTCVCNCPPINDAVIRAEDLERFEEDRAAVDCEDNWEDPTPNARIGDENQFAACVDNQCDFGPASTASDVEVVPPEQWERGCRFSRECSVAIVNQCAVKPYCGATYEGINQQSEFDVWPWNLACDQFTAGDDACDRPAMRAFCQDGACEVADYNPRAVPTAAECSAITDREACVRANCSLIDVPGFLLEDDQCKVAMIPLCLAWSDNGGPDSANNNVARRYYKDDLAMLFYAGFSDWEECSGNTGPCVCVNPSLTAFPSAVEHLRRLEYRAWNDSEPCDETGFVGEFALDRFELTITPDGEDPVTKQLTQEQIDRLQELVVAVPPKTPSGQTCPACRLSLLKVESTSEGRECCGACDPEYQVAFDAVATYLEGLIDAP